MTGQVFIATQGGESVKLGDVGILIVAKSDVAKYLQDKQLDIDEQKGVNEKEIASINSGKVPDVVKNDPDYVKAEEQFNDFERQANEVIDRMGRDRAIEDDAERQIASDQADADSKTAQAGMQGAIDDMKAATVKVVEKIEKYPEPADYFQRFSPSLIATTTTDSEGNFTVSYASKVPVAVFAHAQRMVGDDTEAYYWILDVPANGKSVRILLSNSNLADSDPDGYLKMVASR